MALTDQLAVTQLHIEAPPAVLDLTARQQVAIDEVAAAEVAVAAYQ